MNGCDPRDIGFSCSALQRTERSRPEIHERTERDEEKAGGWGSFKGVIISGAVMSFPGTHS